MNRFARVYVVCALALAAMMPGRAAAAQQQASVTGVVVDSLGGRIAGATVTLIGERQQAGETTSSAEGTYAFDSVAPGRYQVVASAPGFDTFTSEPVYAGAGGRETIEVTLHIGPLQQAVLVTASASAIAQSQSGAPITVIDASTLDALNKPDVLEALRLVPGAQVVQTGARGGTTSFFIRGGASNFNKVLVDGIAANDIGGGFDFAQMATTGVDRVEVLRQTNSVMYGSDALAGVVSITTRRGRSRRPQATFSADGGNLGTWSTAAGIGGMVKRFDYYSEYARFSTDNDLPNNRYRNGTYAGRFGAALGGNTDLSGTIRRTDTTFGSPGGVSLYGIANDSSQETQLTYVSVGLQSQFTDRWQSTLRVGSTDQTVHFLNPTPTGERDDPFGFGANYLGQPVTLRGANGFTVSGRAILDFGGTYPSIFESRATRRVVSGQSTLQIIPSLALSGGARYEREQGYNNPRGEPTATRRNGGAFVEARAVLMNRHYLNAGLGVEHNEVFGEAVTPRLSVASYLRQPSQAALGDTKFVLNVGTGIKAPSVFQAQSSLFALVNGTPAGSGVEPIGPERSRSFDAGIEQGFAAGHARLRAAYFHNTFNDLIEFLSKTALPRAGVPAAVANATAFGAFINSQSYRARGAEVALEAAVAGNVRLMASYTRLNAEVTEAFSASTSFNPAFPGVAIGAFSPLVGQRPFRRPANSGTFMVIYAPGRAEVALSAYFAGKRDDSTFLSDRFFGNSLLLPNRDLDAAYQKIDLSGSYQLHPRMRGYVSIENLLDKEYEASFGFPALPRTARVGFRLTFGGDSAAPTP